jgi:hypothetical protein
MKEGSEMKTARRITKAITLGLTIACAAALWPQQASADHDHDGKKRRHHKRHHQEVVYKRAPVCAPRVYVRERAPRWGYVRPVRYYEPARYYEPVRYYEPAPQYYYDPYCSVRFPSLGLYVEHVRRHRHTSVALAFRFGEEQPLFACNYVNDRWVRIASHDH